MPRKRLTESCCDVAEGALDGQEVPFRQLHYVNMRNTLLCPGTWFFIYKVGIKCMIQANLP